MTLPPELREKAEAAAKDYGLRNTHIDPSEHHLIIPMLRETTSNHFMSGVEWLWGEIMKETKGILFDPLLVFTEASQRNETIRELKSKLKKAEKEIRELRAECSQLREDNLDD